MLRHLTTGVHVEVIKLGQNAFPQLAPGLALLCTLPQDIITLSEAAGR